MSINQLTSNNFSLSERGGKKFLNINLPGAVLCFFKMNGCPGCKGFEPIFHQLAAEENRVNYAILNVSTSRDVVSMSRKSTTSIETVPSLLLFVNGGPHARFNGKKAIQPLRSFINKALQHAPPSTSSHGFMPRGGMYDNSRGYPPSHMAPMQGHAGYSQPGSSGPNNGNQPKHYMPEIGNAPNMKGKIKGEFGSHQGYLEELEDDDEDKLLLPEQVTPYNVPWEIQYKKMRNVID